MELTAPMNLSQILGVLTLLGLFAGGVRGYQALLDENARARRQLLQLQHVVGSEFPAYTTTIDWVDRE